MKRSKFTDEQIVAIVKEGEAGRKVADVCRANGITEQTTTAGRPSRAGSSSRDVQRLRPAAKAQNRVYREAGLQIPVGAAASG